MFTTLKNAFKIENLRKKILFTFAMLVVIRIGSQLPVPGVNTAVFQSWFAAQTAGAFSFFDAITGGSFINMSILALNISPYITSSIIIQLLTIAIPKMEEMQRDGETGKKKMAAITRYVTVGLALIQATAMTIGFSNQGILYDSNALSFITAIVTMTAGSAFLMWIGERITEHGIGNGISMVLVINIISGMPQDIGRLFQQFVFGKPIASAILGAVVIFAVIIGMVVFVIILNDGVRRIPVQYANKTNGRSMVGGNTSSIPLKVNTSGVIPVIFAQSILQLPLIVSMFVGTPKTGFWAEFFKYINSTHWCNPSDWKYTIGLLVYVLLIVFFAYFYTSISFNPLMVADNIKKQGGFIPGIRPGKSTSEYLNKVLNRIVIIGAAGLTFIAIVPYFFSGIFNASVSFGGTSLIIVVSVILETIHQVESQMVVRNYKGFLEK
jgi:preprotein translocase subunit SecY